MRMILTKRDIRFLRERCFVRITEEQERGLLDLLGIEPGEGYVYTEQDIAEQIRKYLQNHPTPDEKGAPI
jgi:hypothetical protein